MKKTVNIMDYCDKLFAADLFAGIVLEEDFDTGCDYTWSAAGDDWADKFRALYQACNRIRTICRTNGLYCKGVQ